MPLSSFLHPLTPLFILYYMTFLVPLSDHTIPTTVHSRGCWLCNIERKKQSFDIEVSIEIFSLQEKLGGKLKKKMQFIQAFTCIFSDKIRKG